MRSRSKLCPQCVGSPSRSQLNSCASFFLVVTACVGAADGSPNCTEAHGTRQCSPLAFLGTLAGDTHGHEYNRRVYAENFGTSNDDWGARINLAVQAAMMGSTVVLPMGTVEISTPIKLWTTTRAGGADTYADNVTLTRLGDLWSSMKGGKPGETPTAITIRGRAGSQVMNQLSTKLVWRGGPDQVMIDMPAPWHVELRDFALDGDNVPGLVGIRYRAGYSFGVNGGKVNTFERLGFLNLDVGMEVGGPMLPDLVGSRFNQLNFGNVGVGIRFFGANVAEMWVTECKFNTFKRAGIELRGYGIREARLLAERNTPATQAVLRDAAGNEIFYEQIPAYAQHQRTLPCPPYCAANNTRRMVGGGSPSVVIANMVPSSQTGWFADSNGPAIRMHNVRLEGGAGLLRNTGEIPDPRFTDLMVDCSNSYGPRDSKYRPAYNDTVVLFQQPARLTMIGGSLGADVVLGNNATVYDVGVRFQYGGAFRQQSNTTGARIFGLVERTPPVATTSDEATSPTTARLDELEEKVARLEELLRDRQTS